MAKLNENIKKYRMENDLTQQEVADQMFVTRQCISRWESGKTLPDINSLEKLANIYNCSINELIDTTEVTEIALNEAIKNTKSRRVIFTSILISVLAITLSIFGIILAKNNNNFLLIKENQLSVKGILTEKLNHDTFIFSYFENNSKNSIQSVQLGLWSNFIIEYPNGEPTYTTFNKQDILEVFYVDSLSETNIRKVIIHERLNGEMIKGFIATPFKEKYSTPESIKATYDQDKIYYFYEPNSTSTNLIDLLFQKQNNPFAPQNGMFQLNFNLYYDPTKTVGDIFFGIVYETTIDYESIFIKQHNVMYNSHSSSGYTGQKLDSLFYTAKQTRYQLSYTPISSFNEVIVYEYNALHELIKTTTITENSRLSIKPHPEAIYAIIKENYNTFDYLANPEPQSKTKMIYIGEKYELRRHIGYGFTEEAILFYK